MVDKRLKLDTTIEKELHKLIDKVAEHTWDFTHLYLRRNGFEIDKQVLETILNVAKLGIMDGYQRQVNFFHDGIRKALDEAIPEVTAETDPFIPKTSEKTKEKSKKTVTSPPKGKPGRKSSKEQVQQSSDHFSIKLG